ncbi:MAG TPA: prepilin-type N-terminal cleavage/methylation domain-containing protein [Campylobacterales bacterium]|nr:prepilin-type N-terminal cleavage/methylation domain-containing protein [Campylobacterales bacterium]
MKKIYKKAFTLIEVIISVVITTIVVMGILKQQSQNSDKAEYLLKRGNSELDNSLFLTKKVQRYTNDKKTAYDLLLDEFSIKDFDSRDILKKIEKKINITESLPVPVGMDENEAPMFIFYTNEVLLNGKYSARYYTFK